MVESDILIPEHLPDRIYTPKPGENRELDTDKLKSAEASVIKNALENNKWNISKAATVLGIGRNTLYRKIKRYNLSQDKTLG